MTGVHKGCPHISTAKHKKSGKMVGKNLGTVINSIEDRREEEKLLGIFISRFITCIQGDLEEKCLISRFIIYSIMIEFMKSMAG